MVVFPASHVSFRGVVGSLIGYPIFCEPHKNLAEPSGMTITHNKQRKPQAEFGKAKLELIGMSRYVLQVPMTHPTYGFYLPTCI